MNLATVFGPSLLRPPVVGLGHVGPAVDISQEVVVQVSQCRQFLIHSSCFVEKIVLIKLFCTSE